MKIAFVIGHSEVKKGAYGNMGISEFDFYREFVPELIKRLGNEKLEHEYQIFYRGTYGSYSENMKELHRRIDSWGADLSISFHFNAASDQLVNGHEILYCSDRGYEYALQLDELFDAYLDNKDRNLKKRTRHERGGGFLCRGRSACILIEPFFASYQARFTKDGDMREPLKQALVDFIGGL